MLIVRLIGRIWKMKRMVSSGNQDDDSREREKKKKIVLVIYIRCMHTTCRNVGYGNS